MSLSSDLISQFVKATNDNTKKKTETTVYGVIEERDGRKFVKIDGSDQSTPVTSTADSKAGERVAVLIKNHTATVIGNFSSPAARVDDLQDTTELAGKVDVFETILADKVNTDVFDAQTARIDTLYAENVTIKNSIVAAEADIDNLQAGSLEVRGKLTAAEADIDKLYADKIDTSIADIKYANIDFSNINNATMGYFYAQSGLIHNVVVGDQTITGELVGVTISGDRLIGNTVIADKLVIKGSDGLYYKLNTDGMKTEAQQTDQNSLNGQIIKAKSITATKISVSDLVAFGATIGGFNITNKSIYSGSKESVGNTTRGIYLDKDGQMAIGDSSNYLKYYKDTDGSYKLAISAKSLSISSGVDIETAINNIQNGIDSIEVGGRNLIWESASRPSDFGKHTKYWSTYSTAEYVDNYKDNFCAAHATDQWSGIAVYINPFVDDLSVGDKLTFSVTVSNTDVDTPLHYYLMQFDSGGTRVYVADVNSYGLGVLAPSETRRISCTLEINQATIDLIKAGGTSRITIQMNSTTNGVYFYAPKLERGNKATDWTPAPEDVDASINNIEIGGRNLFNNSSFDNGSTNWFGSNGTGARVVEFDGKTVLRCDPTVGSQEIGYVVQTVNDIELARNHTISTKVYVESSTEIILSAWYSNSGWVGIQVKRCKVTAGWNDISMVFPSNDKMNNLVVGFGGVNTKIFYVYQPKLELGNKATAWTPSLADVDADIESAAKTASNYLYYDSSSGLQVGNKASGSWSGFRTQITSSAFNILNSAGTVLASYGEKLIELGKNATDAVIKLCGGKGRIEYSDNHIQMSADNVRLKGVEVASLYSNYTDSNGVFRNGAVHAAPADVAMTAGGGSDNSSVHVKPTNIQMTTDNFYLTGVMNDSGNGGTYVSFTKGTSGIWTYKKYANGDLEMWGSYAVSNMDCTTAMGSMYRTAVFSPNAFPFTVYNPNVVASYESEGYGSFLWATTKATTAKPPNYYLVRPTSTTIANGVINFHVFGKWKN